jgi:hypothetical protein
VVKSIYATNGDEKGEIDLQWEAVETAHSYVIQCCAAETKRNIWKHIDIINGSRYTVTGLKPDRSYAFRIASVSKNGQSPWSKPIIKKT